VVMFLFLGVSANSAFFDVQTRLWSASFFVFVYVYFACQDWATCFYNLCGFRFLRDGYIGARVHL